MRILNDRLKMTKYNYTELLTQRTRKEYEIFTTLSVNEDYVAQRVYNATREAVAGCSTMFLSTSDKFKKWITFYCPENQELSYLDTLIIGHMARYPKWAIDYTGSTIDIDSILKYLLASWGNYTKGLKVNMNGLYMLYQRYIRFLNTEAGQNFAYGKSLEMITDNDAYDLGAFYEDKPFYEQYTYRMEQLMKFKKSILLSNCKSALENAEMRALWDVTFNYPKFTYKAASNLVRKEIPATAVSDTSLFKHLKKLRVVMLKKILEHVDEYFDTTQMFTLETGKVVNIKLALIDWLNNAEAENHLEQLSHGASNLEVVQKVVDWCQRKGFVYSTIDSNPTILVKVKCDCFGERKKHWKLYFKKGGGWVDYRNGKTGYFTDIIH